MILKSSLLFHELFSSLHHLHIFPVKIYCHWNFKYFIFTRSQRSEVPRNAEPRQVLAEVTFFSQTTQKKAEILHCVFCGDFTSGLPPVIICHSRRKNPQKLFFVRHNRPVHGDIVEKENVFFSSSIYRTQCEEA